MAVGSSHLNNPMLAAQQQAQQAQQSKHLEGKAPDPSAKKLAFAQALQAQQIAHSQARRVDFRAMRLQPIKQGPLGRRRPGQAGVQEPEAPEELDQGTIEDVLGHHALDAKKTFEMQSAVMMGLWTNWRGGSDDEDEEI